jgi:hypothetical protein
MGLYQNNAGNLSLISGRGKAEYGASTMRTGTVNMTGASGSAAKWFSATVTFSEPMPDANYLIDLEVTHSTAYCIENIQFTDKTVNGFTMAAYHPTGTPSTSIPVKYTAYKLYSDIECSALINSQQYTTNEINTGKKWIDGKPIYRLSFSIDNPVQNWVGTSIINSNVNTLIGGQAMTQSSDGYQLTVPYEVADNDRIQFVFGVINNKLNYHLNNSRPGTITKLWGSVEYTKVND